MQWLDKSTKKGHTERKNNSKKKRKIKQYKNNRNKNKEAWGNVNKDNKGNYIYMETKETKELTCDFPFPSSLKTGSDNKS